MGKYSKYQRKSVPHAQRNPIWRGIGCLLIVIVPTISYFISYAFLKEGKRRGLVPPELTGQIQFPDWVWETPFLNTLARFFGGFNDPWAMLILFGVVLLIMTGLVSFIYAIVAQYIGPPRYTEFDAPPSKRKTKEYKR